MPADPACTAADAAFALDVGAAGVELEFALDEGEAESLDGALVVTGADAGPPEPEPEGAPDEAGDDTEEDPDGGAEDVPLAAAVPLEFIAACTNAAYVLSAVGFTAKTMPFWQWLAGLCEIITAMISFVTNRDGGRVAGDVRRLLAVEPERARHVGECGAEDGEGARRLVRLWDHLETRLDRSGRTWWCERRAGLREA